MKLFRAILTHGVVISEDKGLKLDMATVDELGSAEKVTVDKENTTIVNGNGDKELIAERVAQIKAQIEKTTSDYDRGASCQVGRRRGSALRRRAIRG